MYDATALLTDPIALVDVEDLEDGDLAALVAEVGMPPVDARRAVAVSSAARQAGIAAADCRGHRTNDSAPARRTGRGRCADRTIRGG